MKESKRSLIGNNDFGWNYASGREEMLHYMEQREREIRNEYERELAKRTQQITLVPVTTTSGTSGTSNYLTQPMDFRVQEIAVPPGARSVKVAMPNNNTYVADWVQEDAPIKPVKNSVDWLKQRVEETCKVGRKAIAA